MQYKGYEGIITSDENADNFYGDVINTHDVITFHGASVKERQQAFRDSADDYLEFCKERSEEPEKPFSSSFVVPI
jgi:predicted HicB family RNase H-like nuclease